MFKRLAIFVFSISQPFDSAYAQQALVLQKLNEWNEATIQPGDEVLQAAILKTANDIYGSADECSISEVLIDNVRPATSERYVFSAILGQTLRNAWTVTARLPGCDHVPVRYMVMQDMRGELRTIRVNRGTSYAWESLIGDTLPLVHLAASAALTRGGIDCSEGAGFKLGVIRIASEDENLGEDTFGIRYQGAWSETWPIEICDRTVEVLISFTADGDGGAYSNIPGTEVSVLPN